MAITWLGIVTFLEIFLGVFKSSTPRCGSVLIPMFAGKVSHCTPEIRQQIQRIARGHIEKTAFDKARHGTSPWNIQIHLLKSESVAGHPPRLHKPPDTRKPLNRHHILVPDLSLSAPYNDHSPPGTGHPGRSLEPRPRTFLPEAAARSAHVPAFLTNPLRRPYSRRIRDRKG